MKRIAAAMKRTTQAPTTRVTVVYSGALADAFDRRRFALSLHPALATVDDVEAADILTRFQRTDEPVVLGDRTDCAVVQVEITTSVRVSKDQTTLARIAVEQARAHLRETTFPVHVSAEVVELNYWGNAELLRP